MDEPRDWEIEIDESRAKHKHNVAKGSPSDIENRDIKYCVPCDQFYHPKK